MMIQRGVGRPSLDQRYDGSELEAKFLINFSGMRL